MTNTDMPERMHKCTGRYDCECLVEDRATTPAPERQEAEDRVLKLRGSYDAPGFEACVDAEMATMRTDRQEALDRAFELLDRIETQCKAVGHPVGGLDELRFIIRAALSRPAAEVEELKNTLRDVLKAIVTDRHAVQDTLWVNGTPVGDFIMCALDEEIDLDELQNRPYRCKSTGELPLSSPAVDVEKLKREVISKPCVFKKGSYWYDEVIADREYIMEWLAASGYLNAPTLTAEEVRKIEGHLEYLVDWQSKDGAAVVVEVASEALAILQKKGKQNE